MEERSGDNPQQNMDERSNQHEACSSRMTYRTQKMKDSLATRLNRIEGQIRGIKNMIEKDTYCDSVLNQVASVQSALNSVGKLLLEYHMKNCMVERLQAGETEVLDELLGTINKLIK